MPYSKMLISFYLYELLFNPITYSNFFSVFIGLSASTLIFVLACSDKEGLFINNNIKKYRFKYLSIYDEIVVTVNGATCTPTGLADVPLLRVMLLGTKSPLLCNAIQSSISTQHNLQVLFARSTSRGERQICLAFCKARTRALTCSSSAASTT